MWLILNCFSHYINRNNHTVILSEIIWSLQAYKLELVNSFQILSCFFMEWGNSARNFSGQSDTFLFSLDKFRQVEVFKIGEGLWDKEGMKIGSLALELGSKIPRAGNPKMWWSTGEA